jgi:hypothetical protein
MNYFQLRDVEPQCYHYPNDEGPDVARLRGKLRKISKEHRNKPDPILWFGDLCTVLVLLPVIIPVVIVYGLIYAFKNRRRHES